MWVQLVGSARAEGMEAVSVFGAALSAWARLDRVELGIVLGRVAVAVERWRWQGRRGRSPHRYWDWLLVVRLVLYKVRRWRDWQRFGLFKQLLL